jgi:hypothetical protein
VPKFHFEIVDGWQAKVLADQIAGQIADVEGNSLKVVVVKADSEGRLLEIS